MTDLIRQIVSSAIDDWMMAADVVSIALAATDASFAEASESMALDLISDALERGLLVAGDLSVDGFAAWDLDAADSIAEVRTRWAELRRMPGLGDVCWFEITGAGLAYAAAPKADDSGPETP